MNFFHKSFLQGFASACEFRMKPISKHKSSSTVEKKNASEEVIFSKKFILTR